MNLDPGSSHNSHWREPCGWTAGAILLLSDDSRTVERYWVAMIDQHGLIRKRRVHAVQDRDAPRIDRAPQRSRAIHFRYTLTRPV